MRFQTILSDRINAHKNLFLGQNFQNLNAQKIRLKTDR